MRYATLLLLVVAMFAVAAVASADPAPVGTAPIAVNTAPPAASVASKPAATANLYQRGYRRGWFSGRSAKNWNLNRGTPDDNSTIPTPVNRNPKGRPKNSPVIFPKNM